MSDDIFLHLAQRPNLGSLILYQTITPELVWAAEYSGYSIFCSLKILVCQATNNGIINLISHLRSLHIFDVDMQDRSTYILSQLTSQCPHLWKVRVFYGVGSLCSPVQLIRFAASHLNLRVLDLSAHGHLRRSSHITDHHIKTVARFLPQIRVFKITVAIKLSILSLISLGEYCPELCNCKLSGAFNLRQLRFFPQQLFLQLKDLELQKIIENEALMNRTMLLEEIRDTLCFHAPKLAQLICYGIRRMVFSTWCKLRLTRDSLARMFFWIDQHQLALFGATLDLSSPRE